MKILHTSDWHLGKYLENVSRLEEQKDFINELCDLADDEKADLVLIAGDIFDNANPSSAAEELYCHALDRLNHKGERPVVVIAGNHDSPERLCAVGPLAHKSGIFLLGLPGTDPTGWKVSSPHIQLVDGGPGWLEVKADSCADSAVILAMPFPSEARLEQVLSESGDESLLQQAYSAKIGYLLAENAGHFRNDTVNLIVAHLFMQEGWTSDSERVIQVGGALTVEPSALPASAHYVALGHLHRPQKVPKAPCPAWYSGSPLAYSFSEANQSKVVYMIEVDPCRETPTKVSEHFVQSGRPLVRWVAKKGIEQALEWSRMGKDKGAWIDLEIYTNRVITPEEQRELREGNPGILNIRPRLLDAGYERLEAEGRETKQIDQLFREFYIYKNGTEPQDDLVQTFMEIVNSDDEDEPEPYALDELLKWEGEEG